MRDRLTKERRSWNMSRIRSKNTTPELRVRSLLHKMGFRFRLHVRIPLISEHGTLNLKPSTSKRTPSVSADIVLPEYEPVTSILHPFEALIFPVLTRKSTAILIYD